MDEKLARLYGRWRAADDEARDDDADAAFLSLTESVAHERLVPAQFTARTMAAIADAMAVDARRARRTRKALIWGSVAAGLVAAYFGAGLALSAISSALVATLDLMIQAVVWVATGPDLNLWSLLNSVGRASAAFISDPKVTVAMLAIQGIAIAALVALRRLLASDREFFE